MKTNMGIFDRTVRIVLAIIAGFMVYLGLIAGSPAIVLLAVAAVFSLTSLVGFCPLYGAFGLHTRNL